MIQEDRFFDDAQWIIPGKNEGAGHELDRLGARGDIAQENDVVWNHRVVEEMVLDWHQEVEPHRFRLERQLELLLVDFDVRSSRMALYQWHHADLHGVSPFGDDLSSRSSEIQREVSSGQLYWTLRLRMTARNRSQCPSCVQSSLVPLAWLPSPWSAQARGYPSRCSHTRFQHSQRAITSGLFMPAGSQRPNYSLSRSRRATWDKPSLSATSGGSPFWGSRLPSRPRLAVWRPIESPPSLC